MDYTYETTLDFRKSQVILFLWVIVYFSVLVFHILISGVFLHEFTVIPLFLIVFYWLTQKKQPLALFFLGLSVFPHALGTIPFFSEGHEVSLYNPIFIHGNYDLASHFLGFFFVTLALALSFLNNVQYVPILFLAILGIGAMIEVSEFTGYLVFGHGRGAFAFGDGDNSVNFGPWGDSMTDMYANIAGISLGLMFVLLLRRNKTVVAEATDVKINS